MAISAAAAATRRSRGNGGEQNVSQESVSRKVSRRALLAGSAAGAAAALGRFPAPAIAQAAPFKLGLLTVKTGPLAQGGIQMEQGVLTYLKETDYTMAGRKVDLVTADTGGAPAGAKTKVQELVERDKVDVILGPLAAFELFAITDYIREQKTPMLSLAAADDLSQRRPNPYFLRASATSSQAMHPMGHYAATELKLKRVVDHRARISPSATSRSAASRPRSRKTAAASSTSCGRLWSRPTTRPISRRSPIATASARALPARIRCVS